jgi:hypothetical protein
VKKLGIFETTSLEASNTTKVVEYLR